MDCNAFQDEALRGVVWNVAVPACHFGATSGLDIENNIDFNIFSYIQVQKNYLLWYRIYSSPFWVMAIRQSCGNCVWSVSFLLFFCLHHFQQTFSAWNIMFTLFTFRYLPSPWRTQDNTPWQTEIKLSQQDVSWTSTPQPNNRTTGGVTAWNNENERKGWKNRHQHQHESLCCASTSNTLQLWDWGHQVMM